MKVYEHFGSGAISRFTRILVLFALIGIILFGYVVLGEDINYPTYVASDKDLQNLVKEDSATTFATSEDWKETLENTLNTPISSEAETATSTSVLEDVFNEYLKRKAVLGGKDAQIDMQAFLRDYFSRHSMGYPTIAFKPSAFTYTDDPKQRAEYLVSMQTVVNELTDKKTYDRELAILQELNATEKPEALKKFSEVLPVYEKSLDTVLHQQVPTEFAVEHLQLANILIAFVQSIKHMEQLDADFIRGVYALQQYFDKTEEFHPIMNFFLKTS